MTDEQAQSASDNAPAVAGAQAQRPLVLRSEDLLQGRREVWIEHGGDMYRLRLTTRGKLYLSK